MWVIWYRRNVLVPGVDRYLHVTLHEVGKWHPDWEFIAVGMEVDHVHLHLVIPPRDAVSHVGDVLTANTSRALAEQCAFLKTVYWNGEGSWTTGDFVSTVGADEHTIRRYVEMQGQEDAGQAQLEF